MSSARQGDDTAPAEAGRVTTSLTRRTAKELEALQESTGHSKSDLVNRAISLYVFVTRQMDLGNELLLRNPETDEYQRIQLL